MILPLHFPNFFIHDILFNGTEYVIITNKITSQIITLVHTKKIMFKRISPENLTNKYFSKKSNKTLNKSPRLLYSCNHEIYILNIHEHNIDFSPYIYLVIQTNDLSSKLITPVNIYLNYTNKIIMSTLVLHENDYIIQWIEYYRMLGVDGFIIYDNSNDNTLDALLFPYLNLNIVTIIKWNYNYKHQTQNTQQNHTIWAFRSSSYIGLFDIDEYVNLSNIHLKNFSLKDLFTKYLTDNIGCFKFYCKNFINIDNQSEKHLDFLSVYNCGPVITNERSKSFVIPRNVTLYSIHVVVLGKPTIILGLYFNHYIFLNKPKRGHNKIPHIQYDNSILPLHKILNDRWFI